SRFEVRGKHRRPALLQDVRAEADGGVDDNLMVGRRRHRPVDVVLAYGPPLRLVRVEQAVVCAASEYRGQLPREVVRILDPGVQAEPDSRRLAVRGVAG